jgi:hypothetical protein
MLNPLKPTAELAFIGVSLLNEPPITGLRG